MDGVPRNQKEAFEDLCRELYRPVLGFFARCGFSQDDCRDLAQDTFLRAYRSFGRFRYDAKPLTWLLTIATNVRLNRKREAATAKRSGEEVPLSEASPASENPPPDQIVVDDERRRLLQGALVDLPTQMRRCVWFRVYQQRSYDEIARLLGITAATAKSQVSLARPRLRSILAEHYPELDATDPDDRKG